MGTQDTINKAAETIRAQDTVISGAILALATVRGLYDTAIANVKTAAAAASPGDAIDTSELDAATAEAAERSAALAQAIAINTPASDEVHTDDGGTGDAPATDGGTVVDPAAVDTTAVAAPATGGDA